MIKVEKSSSDQKVILHDKGRKVILSKSNSRIKVEKSSSHQKVTLHDKGRKVKI